MRNTFKGGNERMLSAFGFPDPVTLQMGLVLSRYATSAKSKRVPSIGQGRRGLT